MSSSAPFPKRYRAKFSRHKDGCFSCRDRRKKCDGGKPVCGLCSRSHLDCQWPQLGSNPVMGEALDVAAPKQWTACCTNRNLEADHEGCWPNRQHFTKSGIRRCRVESATCGDNDSHHTLQSDTVPLANTRMSTREGRTDASDSKDGHLPASARGSLASPQNLARGGHASTMPVVTLASPAANRVQLFNAYLSTYVPSNVQPREREGSVYLKLFGFVEELACTHYSHPALTSAMSALSLVSVGSMIRDTAMLRKSSEEYAVSVNRLACAVQKPESVHDDALLAAIMVLATCEFYEPFKRKSQAQGYYSHIVGLHSILAARGPQPPKSRLTSLVLAKAKASSVTKSMFSRQRDFHEAPGWRDLKLNVPSLDQDRGPDISLGMSRLFARNEHLDLGDPDSLHEIDELLRESADLQHDLRSDLDHRVASMCAPANVPVILEDIAHFPRFCRLVADRTLLAAHRFPSFEIAYKYNSYWMRVAMLRSMDKTLQAKRCLLTTDDLPAFPHRFGKPATESELRHYVICLCRNIPFFAEPACASSGDIASFFPLSWADRYFAECKDARWSAWVEDVREHLFVRGVNFPVSKAIKTLEIDERRVRGSAERDGCGHQQSEAKSNNFETDSLGGKPHFKA